MINKIIEYSAKNRLIVLSLFALIIIWGVWALYRTPLDAIPDLSDNQVIVYTEWPGRSPQTMEDQVTYPLVTRLQGVPKVRVVRATSAFGFSTHLRNLRRRRGYLLGQDKGPGEA